MPNEPASDATAATSNQIKDNNQKWPKRAAIAAITVATCNIVTLLAYIFVSTSQLTLTRESNERAYRAWLTVKGGANKPFLASVNGSAELEIIFENTGRSPAQHLEVSQMTAIQLPDWSPPDPFPTDPTQKSINVLGPGQTRTLYFGRKAPFTFVEIDEIKHHRTVLFYVGQITYEDQFSKARGLKFCLRYEPPNDDKPVNYLIPCTSYDKVW